MPAFVFLPAGVLAVAFGGMVAWGAAAEPSTASAHPSPVSDVPPGLSCFSEFASGRGPGPARARVSARRLVLGHRSLSASWSPSPSGLGPLEVRNRLTGQRLRFEGELFEIVLGGDVRLAASDLVVEGPPQVRNLSPMPGSARLAARRGGQAVERRFHSADGALGIAWRAVLRDDTLYLRQEIELTALRGAVDLREVRALGGLTWPGGAAGVVDGVPAVFGEFYLGIEDPHARNYVAGDGSAGAPACRWRREVPLQTGETLRQSFVVGISPRGQLRRAFLHYVEQERAHPYRPFLHYNSWYDIAWSPFNLNETNCLEAIRLFGERFVRPHGVVMDAMVFDDGWDNPRTLWQFHAGFPAGFAPLAEACQTYGTRLGVWLSPFGGYGEPRAQRLRYGSSQGYETNATGFSLAGPRYYAAFKAACVDMIRRYGVNHFKFDGIAAGMYAQGGADYVRDTEAMRRLMLELREEAPDLFINLTTGSWPSPYWLRYADSLWRQGGDMGLAGPGPKQEQWLTYRDQETYRNIVQKSPLYPLNALMTQGVAYSREGSAGEPTFNAAGFKHDVRAFFGGGTCLQELYLQPGKLTETDWRVLAEAARWSRARAAVLVDTHWIGGDPTRQEVYGYASWCPGRGVVMLRNPSDRAVDFSLDVGAALELPAHAPSRWELRSPWSEEAARPSLSLEAGRPLPVKLAPFEVLVFDATPVAR